MVMKAPQTGFSSTFCGSPGTWKYSTLAFLALVMASTCCATTESTGSVMRLNSSKQPQRPPWQRPLKILAQSV